MRTFIFFLNGKPVGRVQFLLDGSVQVSHDSWGWLPRLPVPVFPFIDPQHFRRVLAGMPPDFHIPGVGTLHTEVI